MRDRILEEGLSGGGGGGVSLISSTAWPAFLQVEGGSGNFTWTSSNQTVATVTVKGVVAAGLAEGQSAVQARDVQNPFHFGEIQASRFPWQRSQERSPLSDASNSLEARPGLNLPLSNELA